jgi:hypothetical protein
MLSVSAANATRQGKAAGTTYAKIAPRDSGIMRLIGILRLVGFREIAERRILQLKKG